MDIFLFWFYQYLTMKYKSLLVIFLMLVFSCSSDSEEPNNPEPPTQSEPDTTAPTITIGGLDNNVEILTTLTITITDESNSVNTVILVNDNEVFSTTDKTISYELDPFDFPSGETTFTIQSTDDSNNQGEESQTFELKKLLFQADDIAGAVLGNFQNGTEEFFISLNNLSGELIAFRKINNSQDGKFYAPESFERQNFVATTYIIKDTFPFIVSYANLPAGTTVLTLEEANSIFNLERAKDMSFNIEISEIPAGGYFVKSSGENYSGGRGSNSNNGSTSLTVRLASTANIDNIFLSYMESTSLSTSNIDNYRYSMIPLNDFNDKVISYNDLKAVTETTEINIPTELESFVYDLRGFTDEVAYETNNFNSIYEVGTSNLTGEEISLEIPVINNFNVFQQRIQGKIDETISIGLNQKGLSDFVIPDWNIEKSGNDINILGDIDFITFENFVTSSKDALGGFWTYNSNEVNSTKIPYDSFEIPSEIAILLENLGIPVDSFNNTNPTLSIFLDDYELESNYEDRIFYNFFRNERGSRVYMEFQLNP